MKNIKTQNIPVDFQINTSKKTQTVETSGKDFKKALESIVGEETSEEKKTALQTESKTPAKEDEEFEIKELPWNILATMAQPEPTGLTLEFDLEAELETELAERVEFVTADGATEPSISTEQLSLIETQIAEHVEQPVFILPDNATETALDQSIQSRTVSEEHAAFDVSLMSDSEIIDSNSMIQTSINETESDKQVKRTSQQKNDMNDTLTIKDKQPTDTLENTQVNVPEGVTEEIATSKDMVIEVEVTTEKTATPHEIDVKESTEKILNTDISASGQWTQIKLAASQPQVQTETVKVIPQEQIVQEIETMIVEDLGGTSQVEKVSTTRIQLTPKHLGEMEIELVMKNKELTARLIVEKAETKQWLDQKLNQLTDTLAKQEIKVEQFDVHVSNNQTSFAESSMNDQSFFKEQKKSFNQKQSMTTGGEEEQMDTEPIERNRQSNTGRLSIWV